MALVNKTTSKTVSKVSKSEQLLGNQRWRLNNLYYIVDEKGKKVLFILNESQEKLYQELHYWNIILKARQLGFSTFIDVMALDTALFNDNMAIMIIADNLEDAERLFKTKIKFPYDNLPDEIREARRAKLDSARHLQFNNNSSISVSTSARTSTINFLHVCLSGDTEIMTKNGFTKKITDISSGDLILVGSDIGCSYQKAKELIKNRLEDVGENMYSINIYGYYSSLKLTGNHEVMCRTKGTGKEIWKSAKSIKKGDYIAYPIRNCTNVLRTGDLPTSDKRIKVDYDLGYLVGMYLAEGCIRNNEIMFCLHENETEQFALFMRKFKDYYRFCNIRHQGKDSKSEIVAVGSKELVSLLKKFFNINGDKAIPDAVWTYGRKFLDGLIKGYLDGDGCYKNVQEITVSSIRRQLIDQLRLLLISLRFGYPTIYHRKGGIYYGRNCKDIWTLKMAGATNWKFREYYNLELPEVNHGAGKWRIEHGMRPIVRKFWRRGKKYYWAQVTGVNRILDEKYVYDIVLEKEPHNYVTVNGIVHNSELSKICVEHPDRAKEIKTGSFPAVHAGNMLFIESTARGASGDFYDMCKEAEDRKLKGIEPNKRQFKFHFFPWYKSNSNKLEPKGAITYPWLDEYFKDLELKHGISLSPEQKAWYVTESANLGNDMKSENPSYPEEAFHVPLEGAYYSVQFRRMREDVPCRITKVPYMPAYNVDTYWDIGVGDSTAIWFAQTVGREIHFIDYYENVGEGVQHYANILKEKSDKDNWAYGRYIGPHDLENRIWAIGADTVLNTARRLGIRFEIAPRLSVEDGIESVRQMLGVAWFDEEKCDDGISKLEAYKKDWDNKKGMWKNRPKHDFTSHCADALRMGAISWKSGMVKRKLVLPTKQVSIDGWT